MKKNILKELFVQKKYDEVIELIESLYADLFKEMLDYKNVDYDKDDGYFTLEAMVMKNYPQFRDDLIHVRAVSSNVEATYLDCINALLNTYMRLKDDYKYYAKFKIDEDDDIDDEEDFIVDESQLED